jgi:hypothetical protein
MILFFRTEPDNIQDLLSDSKAYNGILHQQYNGLLKPLWCPLLGLYKGCNKNRNVASRQGSVRMLWNNNFLDKLKVEYRSGILDSNYQRPDGSKNYWSKHNHNNRNQTAPALL